MTPSIHDTTILDRKGLRPPRRTGACVRRAGTGLALSLHLLLACGPASAEATSAPPPADAAIATAPSTATDTWSIKTQFTVTVPEGVRRLRVWLPLPQEDDSSKVRDLVTTVDASAIADAPAKSAEAAGPATTNAPDAAAKEPSAPPSEPAVPPAPSIGRDARGNAMAYLEFEKPKPGTLVVVQTFDLERSAVDAPVDASSTRPLDEAAKKEHAGDLGTETYVPVNETTRNLVATIVAGEKNPAVVARRIYDWMLDHTELWVKDPARFEPSPFGSAVYAMSTRGGGDADLHALYASLARSAGVPARMVYGSMLRAALDGRLEDAGVHTWVEVFLPGLGWRPVDVAVGDMHAGAFEVTDGNRRLVEASTPDGDHSVDPAKAAWWFGNQDTRRVAWSKGRDLVLAPEQGAVAVDAFALGHVEADGRELGSRRRTVVFRRATAAD